MSGSPPLVKIQCKRVVKIQRAPTLEAIASKIPVIATNIDGLREIIENGYSGFLVAYDDEKLLSERIQQIIRRDNKLEDIKKNAFQTVKEKFSSERMIRQYEDFLHCIISS